MAAAAAAARAASLSWGAAENLPSPGRGSGDATAQRARRCCPCVSASVPVRSPAGSSQHQHLPGFLPLSFEIASEYKAVTGLQVTGGVQNPPELC